MRRWPVDGHELRLAFEGGRPVVFIDSERFTGAPAKGEEESSESAAASEAAFEAGLDKAAKAAEAAVVLPPLLFATDCPAATNSLLAAESDRSVLARALPKRLRDRRLKSRFAARNDGYDLDSLVRCCAALSRKPVLVVVQTSKGASFGCFVGEAPFKGHSSQDLIEDGEASAFRLGKHGAAFPRTKSEFAAGEYINAARAGDFIAVALCASTATAAMRLDGRLSRGTSSKSQYFDSPPLHTSRAFGDAVTIAADEEYDVADVEIFSLEVPPPL
jgi:hypothetical protein